MPTILLDKINRLVMDTDSASKLADDKETFLTIFHHSSGVLEMFIVRSNNIANLEAVTVVVVCHRVHVGLLGHVSIISFFFLPVKL